MRVVLSCIILFICVIINNNGVYSAPTTVAFAGSLQIGDPGVNSWFNPTVNYIGCTFTNTTRANYISFPVYFDSNNASIYHFITMRRFMEVLIYTSPVDPENPCTGNVGRIQNEDNFGSADPSFSTTISCQSYRFYPGTYYIVATSTFSNEKIIINLEPADILVTTKNSTLMAAYPSIVIGPNTCFNDSVLPTVVHNFTVQEAGHYDVIVLPEFLSAALSSISLMIYDSYNHELPCENLIDVIHNSRPYLKLSYIHFESNKTYSAVIAGQQLDFGIIIMPTKMKFFSTYPEYLAPSPFNTDSECKPSEYHYVGMWVSQLVYPTSTFFGVDVTKGARGFKNLTRFSTFSPAPQRILYLGNNEGVFNKTAPLTCPFVDLDSSGAYKALFATGTIGATYTLVATPSSDFGFVNKSNYAVNMWILNGPSSSLPTTAPSTASSSSSSSSSPTIPPPQNEDSDGAILNVSVLFMCGLLMSLI